MRIGYARVSTPDQRFTFQRDALEQSGCTKVFQEVASGAKTTPPSLTGPPVVNGQKWAVGPNNLPPGFPLSRFSATRSSHSFACW